MQDGQTRISLKTAWSTAVSKRQLWLRGLFIGPEAGFHGPTGPRNVIYNCDITSPSIGFWMGGMNENHIVVYNRSIVGKGPGIAMRHASFDHIIRGNVFVVREPWPAVFYPGTQDCIGVELIDNS